MIQSPEKWCFTCGAISKIGKIWSYKNIGAKTMKFSNKRGIFFTFAAIVLAATIILSSKVYKVYEMKEELEVVEVRIMTMNNFIKDVEQDLEKGLYISSFRAIMSMSQYISNNGSYITDIDSAFNELIIDGTLNDVELSLMTDSTFTDWVGRIEAQAKKIDILVNFTIVNVSIGQENPWLITINSNVNFSVRDNKGTSSWKRNRDVVTKISIENFEDPLYVVNSQGRVTNAIVKTTITDFVDEDDVSNLLVHLNNSYYMPSNMSPNFLMRLQGILTSSPVGIESLVNLQEFQDQNLPINSRSAVDYIYFGTENTINYRINSTPSWFLLDSEHLEVYEVQNMTI